MPNKMTLYAVIAAFWLAFLAILGVNLIGGIVMPHEKEVATTGYPIEVPEEEVAVAAGGEPEERPSALPLIAAARFEDGVKGFRKCQSCHNVEPGGPQRHRPQPAQCRRAHDREYRHLRRVQRLSAGHQRRVDL